MKLSLSLPIADRRTSHDFYAALGFEAFGEIASDGLPEPLQFAIGDGASLMLIPTGGFGWVIGDNAVAERGHQRMHPVRRHATSTRSSRGPARRARRSSPSPSRSPGATRRPSPTPTGTCGWWGRASRSRPESGPGPITAAKHRSARSGRRGGEDVVTDGRCTTMSDHALGARRCHSQRNDHGRPTRTGLCLVLARNCRSPGTRLRAPEPRTGRMTAAQPPAHRLPSSVLLFTPPRSSTTAPTPSRAVRPSGRAPRPAVSARSRRAR